MIEGSLVLSHPGRQMALGMAGLLYPRLPTVLGHERLRSLPVSPHCGEIHCYLPSNEGTGLSNSVKILPITLFLVHLYPE